ncbi:hypothetical protein [Saccharothrix sp.]|uniref:hypothetical protein n=1 Tax=Saccharothrix sp. TaxID=1873460 RepID=UPI00281191C5|nr:hypothetical protein [Saccharothrix sp.]
MGAEPFITYAEGTDADVAFRAAVEQAQHDYGHGGYTGTIAEKTAFVVIGEPMSEDDARELANRLSHNDDRIQDKRGPAGAIAVSGGFRTLRELPVPPRMGGYPDERSAGLAAADGCLGDGETVTTVYLRGHQTRASGRIVIDEPTTATVCTIGSPEVTGWLFFGWAST